MDGLRHLRERRSAARALTVIAAHRFFYGLTAVSIVLLYRNYFHDSTDTDAALSGLALAVLAQRTRLPDRRHRHPGRDRPDEPRSAGSWSCWSWPRWSS